MSDIIESTFNIVSGVCMFKLGDIKHIYIISYTDEYNSKVTHTSSEDDYSFPKELFINGVQINNAHQIEVINNGNELLMYLTYFDNVIGSLTTTVLTSVDAVNWETKNNLVIENINITDLSDIRVIQKDGRYILFGSYQTYTGAKIIVSDGVDGVTFNDGRIISTNYNEVDSYISGIVKTDGLYYVWYNATEDGAFKSKLSISSDGRTLSYLGETYYPNMNILFVHLVDNDMLVTCSEILNDKLHFNILMEDVTNKHITELFNIKEK